MATNKEIFDYLQKIGNGDGIQGIKENLDDLKDDIAEIKDEVFNKQESLRNRVTRCEAEINYIKEKLKSKSELWSKAWLHILLVSLGFLTIFILERIIN